MGKGLRPVDGLRPVVARGAEGADGGRERIAAAVGVGRVDEHLRQFHAPRSVTNDVLTPVGPSISK